VYTSGKCCHICTTPMHLSVFQSFNAFRETLTLTIEILIKFCKVYFM